MIKHEIKSKPLETEANTASTGLFPSNRKAINASSTVIPQNNSSGSENHTTTTSANASTIASAYNWVARYITEHCHFSVYKWILHRLYESVGRPPLQMHLWNGFKFGCDDKDVIGILHVKSLKTFLKVTAYPDLYFGDEFAAGNITLDGNLISVLETYYRGIAVSEPHLLQKILFRLIVRPCKNNLKESQNNINHHYNIGNDFYKLWLDEKLIYTCAYYPTKESSLKVAQDAKMEHVCRKLHLQPGQTVVEAGCGWGALAIYMAKNYGVQVKAYNISKEQIKYARERAKKEGLEQRIEFILDDYRNVEGKFDAFVSVGMLEHVGQNNYKNLGIVIKNCLKKSGHGLIHFIGRNKPEPMNAWIEQRIFPGANPPTLAETMDILESADASVVDIENLRLHYAKTLEHWLEKYEQETDSVREMFDEKFVISWRLYLAGSVAAFITGDLQLFQISFVHHQNNNIQWTRDFLYSDNQHETREEPKWMHVM